MSTEERPKTLLAYFSRAGENYDNGGRADLEVGNTEVVARMISSRVPCDVYRIKPVEPYSEDYDETVERNVKEQEADARPAIVGPLASIEAYGRVLVGSPIWNVRPPRIMLTFLESYDFSEKTIFPFATHAMSGLGTTAQEYKRAAPSAAIGPGLAVRGEDVRDAQELVSDWLRRIGLLKDDVRP
jgi:flavodoxin